MLHFFFSSISLTNSHDLCVTNYRSQKLRYKRITITQEASREKLLYSSFVIVAVTPLTWVLSNVPLSCTAVFKCQKILRATYIVYGALRTLSGIFYIAVSNDITILPMDKQTAPLLLSTVWASNSRFAYRNYIVKVTTMTLRDWL